MARKNGAIESELTIDAERRSNGRRLCVKWKAVPFWYVVLLSLISVAEGRSEYGTTGGRWGTLGLPSFLSRRNDNNARNALAMVPSSQSTSHTTHSTSVVDADHISSLRGGGAALNLIPAGYNPFGYGLTDLGKQFLDFDGSLESDVGRFLATLRGGGRKTAATMKEQWIEVVRVSKTAQSMRIRRKLDELIKFCLKAGFID